MVRKPLDFLCDSRWLCISTHYLDILYDFDDYQYQFSDPFQSWLLNGHAEYESHTARELC